MVNFTFKFDCKYVSYKQNVRCSMFKYSNKIGIDKGDRKSGKASQALQGVSIYCPKHLKQNLIEPYT